LDAKAHAVRPSPKQKEKEYRREKKKSPNPDKAEGSLKTGIKIGKRFTPQKAKSLHPARSEHVLLERSLKGPFSLIVFPLSPCPALLLLVCFRSHARSW